MEIRLGQLAVDRDGVAEESQGLREQLHQAEAMVRPRGAAGYGGDGGLRPQSA